MAKPKRNPQKKRREENNLGNLNPRGVVRVRREYSSEKERSDAEVMDLLGEGPDAYTRNSSYSTKAKELRIKKVGRKDKRFILINGLKTRDPDGSITFYHKPESRINEEVEKIDDLYSETVDQRYDLVGTYDTRNGMLVFVDEKGDKYVAPSSKDRIGVLKEAGYQQKSQYVPLSNGNLPVDPEIKKKLLSEFHKRERQNERENVSGKLEKSLSITLILSSFLFVIFSLSQRMTGFVISTSPAKISLSGGAILFVLGLVVGIIGKNKK